MKESRLVIVGLMMLTSLIVSSCGGDDDDGKVDPPKVDPPKEQTIAVTGISLNKTTLSLEKGSTETLIANVIPNNATNQGIVWSSSNPSVASVTKNGLVSANSSGSAVIIATTRDGGFTATCQLTVQVSVSSIILSSNNVTIEKGESIILSAQVRPEDATDKTLIWTANDPTIVSVDNTGKIVALQNGTTTVSVKTIDGTIEAECSVTVVTSVVSVLLNRNELSLIVGQHEDLLVSVLPESASNKNISWTSTNESVATVSPSGTVTAVSPGTSTIVVITEDKNKTASCAVTVIPPTNIDYKPYGDETKW